MEAQEPKDAPPPAPQETPLASAAPALTKRLPSTRVAFAKQLDALRAVAAAGGPDRKPVNAAEIGALIGLAGSTVQLTVPFLVDVGLVERSGGGLTAPDAVVSFQQAQQWDAERPTLELAPLLAETWFAKALTPKLSFGEISEKEALAILAREAHATKGNRAQLRLLLDYLDAAGVILRDGSAIRAGGHRVIRPEPIESAEEVGTPTVRLTDAPGRPSSEGSTASHPLIRGLFQELPPPGSVWAKDKHDAWIELAKVAFRMIYTIDENAPPSPTRREEY